MNLPPREPGPRAGLFDQIDYLQAVAAFLVSAVLSLMQGQTRMPTNADLQAAIERVQTSTANARAAITTQIEQLRAAVEKLSTSEAPTQAQIDSLLGVADNLDAATGDLGADDEPSTPTP